MSIYVLVNENEILCWDCFPACHSITTYLILHLSLTLDPSSAERVEGKSWIRRGTETEKRKKNALKVPVQKENR